MDNRKGWILTLGILIILGGAAFALVYGFQTSLDRAVTPVQEMTGDLGTQVASVLHPSPTIIPDPVTIIRDIRSLARLETIQYTVEKVIQAETPAGGIFARLFGDKLIFVAHGKVIAGIDLQRITPDDLAVKGGVLYMTLPAPEIFITALDNEKSYVYDRETGLLTKGDTQLESSARQAAEEEITRAALEDGILEQALVNAETYLYRLLGQLGYQEVIFIAPEATPVP